jgi:hypothetical protein
MQPLGAALVAAETEMKPRQGRTAVRPVGLKT